MLYPAWAMLAAGDGSPPAARITATLPERAFVGQPLRIRLEGLAGSAGDPAAVGALAIFSALGGDAIRVPGRLSFENGAWELTTTVPRGAVQGELRAEVRLTDGSIAKTPPFPVRILPHLRLRPERFELSEGEAVTIAAVPLEDPRPRSIVWRASLGAIDDQGVFQAPARVERTQWARIQACLEDTAACESVLLAIHPFRVQPAEAAVEPGGTVRLEAVAGGRRIPALWRALTPNLEVSGDGWARGGLEPVDAGSGEVEAEFNGWRRKVRLQVTGAPGAAARIHEPYDWTERDTNSPTGRLPYGSHPQAVAVTGDYLYVAATRLPWGHLGPQQHAWIDVYQMSDPWEPAWITAVECPNQPSELILTGDHLFVIGTDTADSGHWVTVWDISRGVPKLVERRPLSLRATALHGGQGTVRFGVDPQMRFAHSIIALDLGSGSGPEPVALDLPDSEAGLYAESVAGNERFLYVSTFRPFGSGPPYEILAFDRSAQPARLVGAFPGGGWNRNLAMVGELLVAGPDLFRIREDGALSQCARIPAQRVLAVDAEHRRILAASDTGLRIIDLTDPLAPRWTGAAAGSRIAGAVAALGGDWFVTIGGASGIEIYPIVWNPGPEVTARLGGARNLYSHRIAGRYAYLAGGPGVSAFGHLRDWAVLQIFDLSRPEPAPAGQYEHPGEVALSVEVSGSTAYLALTGSMLLLDVTNPAEPRPFGSLPHRGAVLAAGQNYLAVADADRKLSVYDIRDARAPRLAAQAPLRAPAASVRLRGGLTVVAYGAGGFDLIHTPSLLRLTEVRETEAFDIAFGGAYLYVAAGSQGLAVFDIGNPYRPQLVALRSLGFGRHDPWVPRAVSVALAGNEVAYVGTAQSYAAVFALDVRNPAQPRIIQLIRHGYAIYGQAVAGISVQGDDVFLGGGFQAEFCLLRQSHARVINLGLYEADHPSPDDLPSIGRSAAEPAASDGRRRHGAAPH